MDSWICDQSIEIMNIIMTAVSMVVVAIITYKAATDVYDRSEEEKRLEYQAHIHMILKEIGTRLDVLRKVEAEIEDFREETLNHPNLSSGEGFSCVYRFYNVLRKIKPDGGFDHYREFGILFAMDNLNNQLFYRTKKDKISNLEELENEIEDIKNKMDDINVTLKEIYEKIKNPYLFFKPKNTADETIVGQVYEKVLNGTSIYALNDDMKQIEFNSSATFNDLCSKFTKKLSKCEKCISESEIFPESVKKKYFTAKTKR